MSNIETEIQIAADLDATDLVMNIATNFASLYERPWFIAAIAVAFFAGQFTHALLRAHVPSMRNFNKATIFWLVQLGIGYVATFKLMGHVAEVEKYAWITGINSIALYYILLWVSTRWFKMPRLAKFLTLRETKLNEQGEVDFGATIKLIRNGDKES